MSGGGSQWLYQAELPAESAADRHRLHAHLPFGKIQRVGNIRAHRKHALRTGPDSDMRARWPRKDGDRLRLNIALMHNAGPICPLDNHLGLAPSLLHIT